ncbi:MAG TPA: hypothetical protein VK572_07445 [Burkholderiales bacterium]|nr:hypothetical protein [Burkholderiales bacterium]
MLKRFLGIVHREKKFLGEELARTQRLMPLLMKPRNGGRWTPEEKRELIDQLKRLSGMGPYIALLVLPGGFALLPLLAWWLDRRRDRRNLRPPSGGT